jgi:hypothetical protein
MHNIGTASLEDVQGVAESRKIGREQRWCDLNAHGNGGGDVTPPLSSCRLTTSEIESLELTGAPGSGN